MQILHKTTFAVLIGFCLIVFLGKNSYAQSKQQVDLEIKQNVTLAEKSSQIRYDFVVTNQTEEFVDGFAFTPGFEILGKDTPISIDLSSDPLAPGESTQKVVSIVVPELVERYGEYRRVSIPRFDTQAHIKSFQTSFDYPDTWGEPKYVSPLEDSSNGVYAFWGDQVVLRFRLKFDVQSKSSKPTYPFFFSGGNQEMYLDSYSGVNSVLFEDSNSYIVLDSSNQVDIRGSIVLNNEDFSDNTPEQDELSQIENLLQPFESWDGYDFSRSSERLKLCSDVSKKITDEGFDSTAFLGLNLQNLTAGSITPSCWVEVIGKEGIIILDPYESIRQGDAVVRINNTDRTKILNNVDRSVDVSKLSYPKYEIELIDDTKLLDKTTEDSIEISLDSKTFGCKSESINLKINNKTDQLVQITSPKQINIGVLPENTEIFEIEKSEIKESDFEIGYKIGSKEYSKNVYFEEDDCSMHNDILAEAPNVGLLALTIFMVVIVFSRLPSRPGKRIAL